MGRPDSKMFACLTFWLAILIGSTNAIAQVNNVPMKASGSATSPAAAASTSSGAQIGNPDGAATDSIAPGTVITMQNWQQYKQFMPDGMVWLFEGQYSWKMPSDVRMEVGPTIIHPLPKNYIEATERYSAQTKVVELPDGALNIAGYQGGIPFPTPAEPQKSWKILANLWFRYVPHISVDPYGAGCQVDRYGSINCEDVVIVYRQLSYNTDPGVPTTIPGGEGKFFHPVSRVRDTRTTEVYREPENVMDRPLAARRCLPVRPIAAQLSAPLDSSAMQYDGWQRLNSR